jgi:GT2 family glycosyltransferase
MGCALLVSRTCFEAVGGFSEQIQVYYEDVDFCLAARAAGQRVWIEPRAVVEHDGMRGFAHGLTPWAALLKARNPWLVMRRHRARLAWVAFLPTYATLIAASALGYLARGRRDVARALLRGAASGARAALGGVVRPVGSPHEVA